jgi:hypothetical protein
LRFYIVIFEVIKKVRLHSFKKDYGIWIM